MAYAMNRQLHRRTESYLGLFIATATGVFHPWFRATEVIIARVTMTLPIIDIGPWNITIAHTFKQLGDMTLVARFRTFVVVATIVLWRLGCRVEVR
jgi:hypothetical protein